MNTNYSQILQQNYLKKIKTILSISLVIAIICLLRELYIDISSYVQLNLGIALYCFFYTIIETLFFYTAIILIILCINKLISIRISEIYDSIDILNINEDHEIKLILIKNSLANKTNIWILFIFLGWSYGSLNQPLKQVLFYISLGGFGIWTIYRLCTLNNAINKYNSNIGMLNNLSIKEMITIGISI